MFLLTLTDKVLDTEIKKLFNSKRNAQSYGYVWLDERQKEMLEAGVNEKLIVRTNNGIKVVGGSIMKTCIEEIIVED